LRTAESCGESDFSECVRGQIKNEKNFYFSNKTNFVVSASFRIKLN
jgi:hypothetical protein